MALTKAVIVRVDRPGTPPIPVMFNPPDYELSKTNQFAEIRVPGLSSTILQYVGGNATGLTMELFFDTTATGQDVRRRTSPVASLTEPDPITKSPPRLLLLWGSLAFPCVVVSIRQKFDYFDARGVPLRATLSVEFKGHEPLSDLAGLAPAVPLEPATRYVAVAGETVQGIAAKLYGDPRRWREIARANGVEDPRAIEAGRALQIPGVG
jgi:nucleoid-associated protein YgaU